MYCSTEVALQPGAVRQGNAMCVAPGGVDVIITDGGGADQPYTTPGKKLFPEMGHRTHDQRIPVADRLAGKLIARQVFHLTDLFDYSFQIGDMGISQESWAFSWMYLL